MTMELPISLAQALRDHHQEHIVRWWSDLELSQRAELQRQLAAIDFGQLTHLWQDLNAAAPAQESPAERARRAAAPRQIVRVPRSRADRTTWAQARHAGNELLKAGRVGAILVAGGEGSRLGFPHPKGKFPIGPVSGKTLFQLLVEQAVARSREADARIPYYVMTSDSTHDETVAFFEEHRHFGLDPRDLRFFRQGTMPAVDRQTGKLLLASRHELVLNPDGHGGILAALDRSKLLDEMRETGIEYLYYHQVDNPLARVCDPAFIGFHAQSASDVSTKVVAKLSPQERMGVAVEVDGRSQIIEYSDLPADIAAQTELNGELRFWAGSTAIHVFSLAFLERLRDGQSTIPFHRAIKKVPHLDDRGEQVVPESENAVKFERFIFDVLPLAERALFVEALRQNEFCPLKNKSGDFSSSHVQQSLSQLYAGWLRSAGASISDGAAVEISPLYAVDAEQLAAKFDPSRNLPDPIFLK